MHTVCRGEVSVYRWPLKRTEEEVKAEEVALAEQKIISPAQEARVDEVTHNLVQWGRELVSYNNKKRLPQQKCH